MPWHGFGIATIGYSYLESALELQVTRKGEGKEHVDMGFPAIYRFDVEERGGRWMIIAFSE